MRTFFYLCAIKFKTEYEQVETLSPSIQKILASDRNRLKPLSINKTDILRQNESFILQITTITKRLIIDKIEPNILKKTPHQYFSRIISYNELKVKLYEFQSSFTFHHSPLLLSFITHHPSPITLLYYYPSSPIIHHPSPTFITILHHPPPITSPICNIFSIL